MLIEKSNLNSYLRHITKLIQSGSEVNMENQGHKILESIREYCKHGSEKIVLHVPPKFSLQKSKMIN